MHNFDYGFLENGPIAHMWQYTFHNFDVVQEQFNNHKRENPQFLEGLRESCIVDSTGASNAIEQIYAGINRLTPLVKGKTSPLTEDEMVIVGYSKALREVYDNYESLNCDTETILKLYGIMMAGTLGDNCGFKQSDNLIMSTVKGVNSVVFVPVSAKDTDEAMEQWEMAVKKAWNNDKIIKLALIPCIIADFLCIHPFIDGNGRMSRLLTILLLEKAGYSITRYFSFEEQINDDKETYYITLREVSDSWYKEETTYEKFVASFLIFLSGCYSQLPDDFL